jgi:membrane protein DedA with SNARE-associated domain
MPFTAVAGMMRFGLVKFFLLCFTGKTIKNTIVAYLGYFEPGTLLRWIGVPI